jgi:hypothetical protein
MILRESHSSMRISYIPERVRSIFARTLHGLISDVVVDQTLNAHKCFLFVSFAIALDRVVTDMMRMLNTNKHCLFSISGHN